MRVLTKLIGATALLCALAAPASAATVSVSSPADKPGVCAGGRCPSLRAAVALADASPGTTIRLRAGTYRLSGGELQVSQPTTILGAGSKRTIIRQTDGRSRVFDFWNAAVAVKLQGLTVTGGHLGPGQSELGAGILTNSPLTLRDVAVVGNTAVGETPSTTISCCQAVAGIVSLRSLTILHSTISNNVATGGGGAPGQPGGEAVSAILASKLEPVQIVASTIAGNLAGAGAGGAGAAGGSAYGAVYDIDASPLTVVDSVFSGNHSTAGDGGPGGSGGAAYGGALFVPDGVLTVAGSTFAGNVLQAGAGTAGGAGGQAFGGAIGGGSRSQANSIINSTFDANAARAGAGTPAGIAAGGAVAEDTTFQLTLVGSTLISNTASSPGGGSYGGNLYDQPTALTLADDIFSGGSAGTGADCAIAAPVTDRGYNLESAPSDGCHLSVAQHDLIGRDPMLGPLARNGGPTPTRAPRAHSPVVGAGGNCLAASSRLRTDQRGVARATPCTIGAVQSPARRARGH